MGGGQLTDMKAIGLIPVRLQSKRLPGKALLNIDGLPLIIHTAKRATLAKNLSEVFVCTDNNEIIRECKKYNINFIKTSSNFQNGTERIASVAYKFKKKIILDIQGDEPLINPNHIEKIIEFHKKNLRKIDIVIPTIKSPYNSLPTIIRVMSSKDGRVMYLSRSKIPHQYTENVNYIKKHLSIISFSSGALAKYAKLERSFFENIEDIELLRALENNMKVYSFDLKGNSFSVDIYDDYLRAKTAMSSDPFRKLY